MAGNTRYKLAKKVLEKYKGKDFCLADLKGIIMKELSGNEKTVLDYLLLMRSTDLIHEFSVRDGVTRWFINLDEEPCQEQITKEEQTKKGEY